MTRQIKDAEHKGADIAEIDWLKEKLERLRRERGDEFLNEVEFFWTSGFNHQKLPVITSDDPEELQFFEWGLIPFWVKDDSQAIEISNKTLNARSETIFQKPSFRDAAKNRRCLVVVSGYYEHHWVDKSGKTKIPYFIKRKDSAPIYLAGLWDKWINKDTGEEIKTVSIVTTKANSMLSKIHNRKPDDPRMLSILTGSSKYSWLTPIEDNSDIDFLVNLCQPISDDYLESYPVAQLRGKNGIGNVHEASMRHSYNIIGLP
ncbi:MAG: SOS response-associated peptidase [Cytophagia bacterium]|nr:SOS response-associated peptidase [Cytophagia bacterium]